PPVESEHVPEVGQESLGLGRPLLRLDQLGLFGARGGRYRVDALAPLAPAAPVRTVPGQPPPPAHGGPPWRPAGAARSASTCSSTALRSVIILPSVSRSVALCALAASSSIFFAV